MDPRGYWGNSLVNVKIFIEGGGDSKELRARCREGFRKLLESCEFQGKMPRLSACGGRGQAFKDFETALANRGPEDSVLLWIDSEEPMKDIEKVWEHLSGHDKWKRPAAAKDEQVLLMVTCMESWIATDHETLKSHFGQNFQVFALPDLDNMESRNPKAVLDALHKATKGRYKKGKRSFEILGKLNPDVLRQHLPSFVRCEGILKRKLGSN